ncbi:hypothetical protein LWI28_011382 [Acer negundo]|uniref:At2g29880-like C-terminal domain-containing protein n=1 Tax=Acer negundo TaxID=4023 RepID=A0AAD5P1T2_ACENE|nr:hypothetical protein LWI28_011382 [Acer negundo]
MGDAQEGNRKGKAMTDYNNWSIEEREQNVVTTHGWHDANGMLSKAIVESRILPPLDLGGMKPQRSSLLLKKFGKITLRGLRNKKCDDYEDLQIVIGNATATKKNSLGFGDETDARTFGVEDRHIVLDDFVYDETNEAFVANQNEPSHQPPPLGQSSSPLPFPATSSEVHPISTSQKRRTRADNEGNMSSSETNNKAVIMEKISLSIDSIAVDFWGVHSLLEKREKDREKSEVEKREKERQSCIWYAIKKTPNLDERAGYKAVTLLTNKTKKEEFFKMSTKERSNWITYNLE